MSWEGGGAESGPWGRGERSEIRGRTADIGAEPPGSTRKLSARSTRIERLEIISLNGRGERSCATIYWPCLAFDWKLSRSFL